MIVKLEIVSSHYAVDVSYRKNLHGEGRRTYDGSLYGKLFGVRHGQQSVFWVFILGYASPAQPLASDFQHRPPVGLPSRKEGITDEMNGGYRVRRGVVTTSVG